MEKQSKKEKKRDKFGPGFLVAAAFIGPGTVTSATLAGARFGYALAWVVVVATLAAIVLQEMVGRFSLATRLDVGAALARLTGTRGLKIFFQVLAFLAIVVGCTAYEAGNIVGGGLGLHILTGVDVRCWVVAISVIAWLLLLWRNYKWIERCLIALVVVMGVSFLVSALIVRPDLDGLLRGFIPRVPRDSLLLVLALLGTTVVPYNLFLHSAAVLKKWRDKGDIPWMRKDACLSIGLGGVITLAIVVTAAAAYFFKGLAIENPVDLSRQLAPLYGPSARLFFGIGFFAAGLSSAITAPYAAAWTAAGLFNWKERDWRFSLVFSVVLLFGLFVGLTAIKPLQLIVLAQVANALLLPIVSLFVVYLLNKKEVGEFKNTLLQNLLFLLVFLIILLIHLKHLL
jgi:manganese transport protein